MKVKQMTLVCALAVLSATAADTRLEYIETTGTQYVDTGVELDATTAESEGGLAFESDMAWVQIDRDDGVTDDYCYLGAKGSSSKSYVMPIMINGHKEYGGAAECWYRWTMKNEILTYYRPYERVKVSGSVKAGTGGLKLSFNDIPTWTGGSDDAGVCTSDGLSFYLFAENNNGVAKGFVKARCFGLKLWKDGELVRNFVPVRRESDQKVGLYDEVSKTFFINRGDGAFVAGPVCVPPAGGKIIGAEGGEVSSLGDDRLHVFTEDGTLTVKGDGVVDVLVVGGGGGGGASYGGGGGGGGGGVVYRQGFAVTGGVYRVSVGAGGAGADGSSESLAGGNGGNSSVFGLVAFGGGGGGKNWDGAGVGGCGGGGGATYNGNALVEASGGWAYAGQGGPGGHSSQKETNKGFGGGGGGAGSVGGSGCATNQTRGVGGAGRLCTITGEENYYGGGGGGGMSIAYNQWSNGGLGGGGRGGSRKDASKNNPGESGTPGTGGGGGGGGHIGGTPNGVGGNGGSGIVIVRYTPKTAKGFASVSGGTRKRLHTGAVDGFAEETHTFAESGLLTIEGDCASYVDVLVVGGGGGGGAGYSGGGGGGAGGVIYREHLMLAPGEYEIVVGAGGKGGRVTADLGAIASYSTTGGVSSAFGLVAKGGGQGGNTNAGGGGGGSGGGGAAYLNNNVFKRIGGGDRVAGQGNYGGGSTNVTGWCGYGGGGGGAGEVGHDGASPKTETSGCGGDGIACSITGEEKYYGGGGGGGSSAYVNYNTNGWILGGKGGGGNGNGRRLATEPFKGTAGEPGTGGGGGGGGGYTPMLNDGGDGGSGIVIVRCWTPAKGLAIIAR